MGGTFLGPSIIDPEALRVLADATGWACVAAVLALGLARGLRLGPPASGSAVAIGAGLGALVLVIISALECIAAGGILGGAGGTGAMGLIMLGTLGLTSAWADERARVVLAWGAGPTARACEAAADNRLAA